MVRKGLLKHSTSLNASQWESLVNDVNTSDGVPPTFSAAQIAAAGTGSNWQQAALRSAPILNDELTYLVVMKNPGILFQELILTRTAPS